MINKFFQDKIENLQVNNLYRSLKIFSAGKKNYILNDGKKCISFCSNDYLGLSQDKEVRKAASKAINKYGFGSGSSRYILGNNSLYQALEGKLSDMKNSEDAIIFGSGYLAGTSIVPAIAGKGDLIVADKLIHSCLIDGCKLSGAKLLRFEHNNINRAQEILEKERENYKKCLIITETVFSMDGDLGKIEELLKLALKFDSLLLSDDAHGIGILEKEKEKDKYKDIHLKMGTLSKAVGGYGGYVCSSKIMIDYLRNFARSAIYSTALPPAILAGNLKALRIISKDTKKKNKALENANYFCSLLSLPETKSTIVPIVIGETEKTLEISKKLEKKGFLVSAIRPPTVENGKSRLRITFSTFHKKKHILELAELLLPLL